MKDVNILKNNGVNLDVSLDILGDMDMYNETLEDFLNEIDSKKENLTVYKLAQDMPNYAIYAHSIKSDAKYLGFTKLAEIAFNHEIKAKENDFNYVIDNFDAFIEEIDHIINLVKKYLDD